MADIQAKELATKLDDLPVEACFKIVNTFVEALQRRLGISPEEAAAGAKRLVEQSGIMKGQLSEVATESVEAVVQSSEVVEQCASRADGDREKAHASVPPSSAYPKSPPSEDLFEGAAEKSGDRSTLANIEEKLVLILRKETDKLRTGGSVSVANCRDTMTFVTFAFMFIEVVCGRSASDLAMDAACWVFSVLSGTLGGT
nr:hypothetical protein B0A51_04271 [Rachicladosporium sp. CCFEE 5018]